MRSKGTLLGISAATPCQCLTLGRVQTSAFLSGNPAHCPSVEALCHVLLGLFYYEGKTIITRNSKSVFYLETGFGDNDSISL